MFMRLLVCLLFFIAPAVHAASFNCKEAHTPREKTICSDPELSHTDSELAGRYAAVRSHLSHDAALAVQQDQRSWLAYLDKACSPQARADRANMKDCLNLEYSNRSEDLNLQPLPGNQWLYTRAQYIALPSGDNPAEFSSVDPGVGIGRFTWPQIDRPTEKQAQWNTAISRWTLQQIATREIPHPTSFASGVDTHSSLEITYSLRGANTQYLLIDFERFFLGYGAAHPLTQQSSYLWSFSRNREIAVTDVFNDHLNWRARLLPLVRLKLRSNREVSSMMWQGAELNHGIEDTLNQPEQWTLTPQGLTLNFAQYQVAAYAAGMPAVTLSWQQLKPWMNPSFVPDQLPTLLEKPDTDTP